MLKTSDLTHKEDLLNYWRAWLSVPILLLPAFTGLPGGFLTVLYGLLIWFLLNDMNFLLHQHVHRPLTHSNTKNTILDWWMSLVTAMCAYNWRQQHVLRHHYNNNSWGEPTPWEFEKDTLIRGSVYAVKKGASMFWFPFREAIVYGLKGKQTDKIDYRKAAIQHSVIVMMVVGLMIIEPYFYIPYYFFVYFFTTLTDYDNHVGCDDSRYGFSNNCMNPHYNVVRNNFGYHTAHHYNPSAHWTELPKLHATMADKIPQERITHKIWTGFWTPPVVIYYAGHIWKTLFRTSPQA